MDAAAVIAWLEENSSTKVADGLSRYGIATRDRVLGVSMNRLQTLARSIRRSLDAAARHDLAEAMWGSGLYEGRMLAPLIDDPGLVTAAQMNRWARSFDNWAVCDTACFSLFDRAPLCSPPRLVSYHRAKDWAGKKGEFHKRAGFALIASLALHDKAAPDSQFLSLFPVIAAGAEDTRNFVKKGVSWALRGIGRRSKALHASACTLAHALAASDSPSATWVGRDVLRDLNRAAVKKRLTARRARRASSS